MVDQLRPERCKEASRYGASPAVVFLQRACDVAQRAGSRDLAGNSRQACFFIDDHFRF